MGTAIDVAQYIYNKQGWVDAWRLAKLTYYSQAWSLGWFGRSMITEEFQAWADGPVEPKLHSENKYNRSSATSTSLPSANFDRLSDSDKAVIDSVLDFYGKLSKEELIEKTHAETPWQEARRGEVDGAPSKNPLSQSTMKTFYALQEIQGEAVPTRPKQQQRSLGPSREKLMSTASRWKTALDLLALK